MLAHPYIRKFSIDNYKHKILQTFMLPDGEYITRSLDCLNVKEISNIQCQLSTRKTMCYKKINERNIANIYVRIFGKSLHFRRMVHIWMIQPILYAIFSNIIFNNNMIKIYDISFIITGYILQHINIHKCRENRNHYMLSHPNFNEISIDTYKH